METEQETEVIETEEKNTADVLYGKAEVESEEKEAESENQSDSEESESEQVTKSEEDKDSEKDESKEEEASEEKAIEYDLKLNDESFLKQEDIDDVLKFAKDNGLSKDAASEVLSKRDEAIANFVTAQAKAEDVEINEWANQVKADSTMGGDNLGKTVEDARRVVEKFGSTDFIKVLEDTGYGNHPEVVRFLSNLGSNMSDDSLIMPGAHGESSKSVAELFYGKTN